MGRLASPIHSLEVSADGQWLFAGSVGGEPKLWNLISDEQVPVAGEADWAWGAFSPDSRLLLACAETLQSYGKIFVGDLHGRKRLESILDPRRVGTMAFSADGQMKGFCIPRHGSRPSPVPTRWPRNEPLPGAVNVSFFDGHGELVKLDRLWQLYWHNNYRPPAKRPGLP